MTLRLFEYEKDSAISFLHESMEATEDILSEDLDFSIEYFRKWSHKHSLSKRGSFVSTWTINCQTEYFQIPFHQKTGDLDKDGFTSTPQSSHTSKGPTEFRLPTYSTAGKGKEEQRILQFQKKPCPL